MRTETVTLTNMCMVYDDEGNVLVQDKVDKKWSGLTFPGGHIEKGESFVDSVIREVYEETGLRLTSYRYRGIVTFVFEDEPAEYMSLYTADGFEGSVTNPDGSMKECNEGVLAWVKKADVGKLNLWEGDRIFLRLLDEDEPFFSLKLVYQGDDLVEAVLNGKRIK